MHCKDSNDDCGKVELIRCVTGSVVVHISGNWTRHHTIDNQDKVLKKIFQLTHSASISFDCKELRQWDSRLPAFLLKAVQLTRSRSIRADLSGLPDGVRGLLVLALEVPERSGARREVLPHSWFMVTGQRVLNVIHDAHGLVAFIGETQLAFWKMLKGKARFRMQDLYLCIQEAGAEALPIVTLISLLIGLILAFVGAVQLAMFGAQVFIANLVGLGTVREMGALMTAVIMSGRTGAAYAAQLGTMNVNSEIDAIKTMGLSPMEFLVLPRMLALLLMMPLLCLYANFVGIMGGALVTVSAFDVSFVQYYNQTCKAVQLADFSVGLFKSMIFAVLIATAGCMRGMQCGRSASAVGDAATAAVVNSIVYIVVADSIITLICNHLGI